MQRMVLAGAVLALGVTAAPAAAQFYLRSPTMSGQPIQGDEPGMVQPMPGATPAELRASLVWSMRAALNVAALQCQFEPTLLTVANYNAVLKDHGAEFKGAFDALGRYYTRVGRSVPRGQAMLDQYGTRTYSSFVTVGGQFAFCQTAAAIGRDAVFTPRGQFATLAANRLAELRSSLTTAFGEIGIGRFSPSGNSALPRLDAQCWDRRGNWVPRKCGPLVWPPA
ncbi:hypothetical protein [Sphingomonas sp.]|uniref:hypothetical protein n=1 Tax=Sphingomonas sp. TaxID=28214 RepID=UPI003CC6CB2F